ncbi:MAG: WD40-repeat-containing domain protein, partial [Olpidium bornovanus]
MVKSYLRYEPERFFGVVASSAGNAVFDSAGRHAIAPALEDVVVWDLKKGEAVATWHDSDNRGAEVTCVVRSPNGVDYAVGYADGSIRIWSRKTDHSRVTFNGHRGAVTALAFDRLGALLASGSKDTDLIVWDVVGETGLYRCEKRENVPSLAAGRPRGVVARSTRAAAARERKSLTLGSNQVTGIAFLPKPVLAAEEKEGKGEAPAEDLSAAGYLVSCSKDTLLKLWDLATQHCVETHVAHRSECWAMDVDPGRNYLVTGGGDAELKMWKLDREVLAGGVLNDAHERPGEDGEVAAAQPAGPENTVKRAIRFYGPVARMSRERVITLQIHPSGRYLGCQAADKAVEIFRVRTEEEVRRKMARRKKRQKEKSKEKAAKLGAEEPAAEGDADAGPPVVTANDELQHHQTVRAQGKVRSFDFAPVEDLARAGSIQILTSLTNNVLEVHSSSLPPKIKSEAMPEPECLYSIDRPGHRGDVRALALSSDDELLCSGSNGARKRSLNCGHTLTASFLPGNRHVIVGTKSGDLELYDIQSASLVEKIETAHDGAIWSLQVRPDKRGLVTGGADKDVKFWDFDMVEDVKGGVGSASSAAEGEILRDLGGKLSRRLFPRVFFERTLKMADDVLCVRYSPDQKLIAVALLDATVKVFFHDTLKFYLSLYGH